MNLRKQSGQTLLEAIVALGIIVLGVLGVLALTNQSLGINRSITDRYSANYLAAEGVEVIKNIIDTNVLSGNLWNEGLEEGVYELDHNSTSLDSNLNRKLRFSVNSLFYGYDSGFPVETPFTRKVSITYPDCPAVDCLDHMQVNSLVSWVSVGGGQFQINLEDHFFDWDK